jgi:nucleotide-binding universal stress UspA family protein
MDRSPLNPNSEGFHFVWAVEPGQPADRALHHRARKLVHRLLRPSQASIAEPVYVFRLSTLAAADTGPMWRHDLLAAAEDSLQNFIHHLRIPGIGASRVILSDSSSYRKAANALVEHAGKSGADAIVAHTHGRTGIGRFFLGSFAETLLAAAKMPLLLVNPKTKVPARIERILHPTDFSVYAPAEYRDVLRLAERFHSGITLLHITGTKGAIPRARKHADRWAAIALGRGIAFDSVIRERTRDASEEIISAARDTGAGLIAMESNTGALTALVMGSTTRQVIRKAPCPVWVLKLAARQA